MEPRIRLTQAVPWAMILNQSSSLILLVSNSAHEETHEQESSSCEPFPMSSYDDPLDVLLCGDGGSHCIVGLPALLNGSIPDSVVDWGTVENLQVRAASVRGRLHRHEGSVRQDAFFMGLAGKETAGYLILAVADGVGSLPFSHIAAEAAVRSGVETMRAIIERADTLGATESAQELEAAVREAVVIAAQQVAADRSLSAELAAKRMATTLLVAALEIKPGNVQLNPGLRRCRLFVLGDSSAWILRREGKWEPLAALKGAGAILADSRTLSFPSSPLKSMSSNEAGLRGGDTLFLFTDGIGDPLGDGAGAVGQTLARQWANPPEWPAFLRDVDFARRSHKDDRTAIGVWTPPLTEPVSPPPLPMALGGMDGGSIQDKDAGGE